jgi:hypothetical protein
LREWIGQKQLRQENMSQQDEAFHGELDSASAGMFQARASVQTGPAAAAKAETVQPTRQVTTSPESATVRTDSGFQRLTSLENSR